MNHTPAGNQTAQGDMLWFLGQARPRRLRTMRQFAEDEIVIPDGPFAGRRFRCHRQPYTGLWFDQIDTGHWTRFVATGPTQSGKTVACFVIPLIYHLFEIGETVICGLPDMEMAYDKWRHDILPIVERSRFRELLPSQGGGSRGGQVQTIRFRNGATLKFMSGGGGDKSRAGFTARVVVITETDGMDEPGRSSREADKVSQLIARTRAYGQRSRIYMECTVSTETGRTWQEYSGGSRSRILLPCPHCKEWVSPERDHLVGWQESETQADARKQSMFFCSACGQCWSSAERIKANKSCRLVHDGQTIDPLGNRVGELPSTDTLGFRWSAVNNLFLTAGDVGADEWRASRSSDEDNAEREMRQFVWCMPVVPTKWQDTEIATHELASRTIELPRGVVPQDATILTAAIDLGKYLDHWIVVAWSPGPRAHVVDYGRMEVASEDLGVEQATIVALRQLKEMMLGGWPRGTPSGELVHPNMVWIDSGYMTEVVYTFVREAGQRFLPAIGRGAAQQRQQTYNKPTQAGSVTRHIGEGFHINWLPTARLFLCEVDADHWKTWVHQRLSTPVGNTGAMTLFQGTPQDHLALAKHLTAEVKTEEFIAGKGVVTKWERRRRQNHWLDALYNACAVGHYCGVRLVEEAPRPAPPKKPQQEPPHDPNHRPWIDVERSRRIMERLMTGRQTGY